MDIKILDSWLKEFLVTRATPKQIAEYLSLCGPSIERIEKFGDDSVYDIEITTNRIDTVSVYGIAREAAAILPRFRVPAKLKPIKNTSNEYKFVNKVKYLDVLIDPKLCKRFTAVLIKNVSIGDSPELVQKRLESAGVRSINNIVDISNYIMLELGQPVHTFDYDKIKGHKMILRESKKGEKITTLDSKEFILNGGDIVIEDGEGRLIDLAGVMGGALSAVDENTKNVLLFVQTYDPAHIRKTSMGLAQRTMAATIFEKGTDPELVTPAILKGIELFKSWCKTIPEPEIVNIYSEPYKSKSISVDMEFIEKRLGVSIPKKDITEYLSSLEFETSWSGQKLTVKVPSFRAQDITRPEDVVEEIARIYGYHNLPSTLMTGRLTGRVTNPQFSFENDLKSYLSGWGGSEVYTLSLVPKDFASVNALKLKNSLGTDSEYLRTTLMPSLIQAANENRGTFECFHLFESANIYIPRKSDLPEEKMILAGIFEGHGYRLAKGIIEAFLEKISIGFDLIPAEQKGFAAGKCVSIVTENKVIGHFGYTENSIYIYYEFEVENLYKLSGKSKEYQEISKYPPQIEDITLTFPEKTMIGPVIDSIKSVSELVSKVELGDIYKDAYTFHIEYHNNKKTLTDKEVEEVRNKILVKVKGKFGGQIKD